MVAPSARRPVTPDPLPVGVVDNHAHLDMARYGEEGMPVAEALAAAGRLHAAYEVVEVALATHDAVDPVGAMREEGRRQRREV